jgi:hypothetical protein
MFRTLPSSSSRFPRRVKFLYLTLLALGVLMDEAAAVEFLPFDTQPPQFDISKVPKLPPGGATFVPIDLGRMAAIGPKGILIIKLAPAPPVPPGIESATQGVEIRLATPELSDAYQSFTYNGSGPDDPDQVISFARVFADGPRLAACGFYIVKTSPQHPGKQIGDHFHDMRSYLAIGDLARLPVNFLKDDTKFPARPDGKFSAACVDSNIRWDAAYASAPLALHLEPKPLTYQWTTEQTIPLGPGH